MEITSFKNIQSYLSTYNRGLEETPLLIVSLIRKGNGENSIEVLHIGEIEPYHELARIFKEEDFTVKGIWLAYSSKLIFSIQLAHITSIVHSNNPKKQLEILFEKMKLSLIHNN